MSIAFDTVQAPLRGVNARRSVSAPSSLLNRIQKPPLLNRLGKDDIHAQTPSGPRAGAGPIRSRPHRGGAAQRPAPRAKQPKTAEDLDKELEAFMVDKEEPAADPSATAPTASAPQPEGDVEMV